MLEAIEGDVPAKSRLGRRRRISDALAVEAGLIGALVVALGCSPSSLNSDGGASGDGAMQPSTGDGGRTDGSPDGSAGPDFFRDVQPILSAHCFACHGADQNTRQGNLRMDLPSGLFDPRPNGAAAVVVKGDPDKSLLYLRISASNPAARMPPAAANNPLTDQQIATIRAWIAAGAAYPQHWAFLKPVRPTVPAGGADLAWSKNPIDAFLRVALETAHLTHAGEADREALIRRASFDVRGLPPTPAEIDAFLADDAPDAYPRLVDRLLDDPAYGEHRAHYWLDVARYADTNGFEVDQYRSIWPYRDWVVNAFNANMPYDEFTIEQLAGDLLPQPTLDQMIATGFGRNAMCTDEGGVIEEEFAAIAAKDRVETVSAAWLGLTTGCADCHDHKFDPISQRDFYRMTAFFRNTTQPVLDDTTPATPPVVLAGPDGMTPTLVTVERADAPVAYVLTRGQYDQPGEPVTPGVPGILPPLPANQPANRLGLAVWLTSPDHPLMTRVVVNRFWAEIFGTGLVATADNFGTTGEGPVNQPLLDWLAVELRESGWDVKHLFRLMLTSAAYRQSAVHTAAGDAADPENRLLWHGPRFRLDGEEIRDQALLSSGLLVRTMGGPSVKPYQPAGLWEAVAIDYSNTAVFKQDKGDALYRRSVYTFWKRASPPPTLQLFNAPSREQTVVSRDRTNTPLQALATMNDPQFLEAARHLVENALHACATATTAKTDCRLDHMSRRVLGRRFAMDERLVFGKALATFTAHWQTQTADVARILAVGDSAVDGTIDQPELAAWMMLANVILNLDEALEK